MHEKIKAVFIAGTDTGIGKTYITTELLRHINFKGYKTFGTKPIASGCDINKDGILKNSDALAIQRESSILQPYNIVNPIALQAPMAPNIASNIENIKLSKKHTVEKILSSLQPCADINIIVGIGGWLVPLNNKELLSEVISLLRLPIVLVVGIRLGCLNHAILTSNSIVNMGLPFIGWIANCLDPQMLSIQENVETLIKWISAPYLGTIPYLKNNKKSHYATLTNVMKASFAQSCITR